MDLGLIRGLITVALLVLFIGLWVWSWSKKRSAMFDAAAQLPLDDDEKRPASEKQMEQQQ